MWEINNSHCYSAIIWTPFTHPPLPLTCQSLDNIYRLGSEVRILLLWNRMDLNFFYLNINLNRITGLLFWFSASAVLSSSMTKSCPSSQSFLLSSGMANLDLGPHSHQLLLLSRLRILLLQCPLPCGCEFLFWKAIASNSWYRCKAVMSRRTRGVVQSENQTSLIRRIQRSLQIS